MPRDMWMDPFEGDKFELDHGYIYIIYTEMVKGTPIITILIDSGGEADIMDLTLEEWRTNFA